MNTANLQLEGLYLAIASVTALLVRKGIVSADEIDEALRQAERGAMDDVHLAEVSPSNRDAVIFPLRWLQLANRAASEDRLPSFSDLARAVGATKPDRRGLR